MKKEFDLVKPTEDWKEAFNAANIDINIVEECVAAVEGWNDGENWVGIFKFKMGEKRFLVVSSWCDYTGWDCRAGGEARFFNTFEEALAWLPLGDRIRLEDDKP